MQSRKVLDDRVKKGYYNGVIGLGKEVDIDFQKIDKTWTQNQIRDLFRKYRLHLVEVHLSITPNRIPGIKLSEDYILENLEKVCDMFRNPLLQCFLFIK